MKTFLSIVIPVYNERENIEPLWLEIKQMADALSKPVEVIWVDDGSVDGSFDEIKKLAAASPVNKGIKLGRNFGQTAALKAAIDVCAGEIIAPMDADGQNDPADIISMLKKLDEGYDIVSGWRKKRKDKRLTRIIPSVVGNWLISKITKIRIHDCGCSLKLYRRQFLAPLKIYGEMHPFLPALCAQLGAKIAETEVNHRPRMRGKTKYSPTRIIKNLLDALVVGFMGRYISKPIHLFGGWGVFLIFCSAICAAAKLFLYSLIFALGGIQLVFVGLIAQMISRLYYEDKPPYFIKEKTW
ncbi:MAG: glycosyltransferase family 2 protein [Elusimicrobia bacterium]|nr:glycosyltransferase family 2 protein [Elusimicrobiota bacterium]